MFSRIKKLIEPAVVFRPSYPQYVTVFSHPRSGTHFLEAFIAENFYKGVDLFEPSVWWGHWANRQVREEGNQFGKLFGSHIFPDPSLKGIDYPLVYIFRDGRAVAFSVWKTANFIHPRHQGVSFSDFLRVKIDWQGSPAFRYPKKRTIAEHWELHVDGWIKLSQANQNILVVRYEDVVRSPYQVYLSIRSKFFATSPVLQECMVNKVTNSVGLLPNMATIDSWKQAFSYADETEFKRQVGERYLYE